MTDAKRRQAKVEGPNDPWVGMDPNLKAAVKDWADKSKAEKDAAVKKLPKDK